jgi:hypothetical protein
VNIDQWNAAVDVARAVKWKGRMRALGSDIDFTPRQPKPGSLHPFKHASALYTAIIETRARLQDNLFELQQALAAFPPYVSRGHGWKGRIKNRTIEGRWNQDRSKYLPHQGVSEAARRVYQGMNGTIRGATREIAAQLMEEGI